jgi:hypothetical protein
MKKSFLEDNPWIPQLKDVSVLIGWIGGLLLIGGLCWFLSGPLRARLLMNSVNRVLALSGDPRRLDRPLPFSELGPGASRMGVWYTVTGAGGSGGPGKAFVFTVAAEGAFFPCAAEIDPDGKVKELIPLSRHGEKMIKRLPAGLIRMYIRRIEGAEGESL